MNRKRSFGSSLDEFIGGYPPKCAKCGSTFNATSNLPFVSSCLHNLCQRCLNTNKPCPVCGAKGAKRCLNMVAANLLRRAESGWSEDSGSEWKEMKDVTQIKQELDDEQDQLESMKQYFEKNRLFEKYLPMMDEQRGQPQENTKIKEEAREELLVLKMKLGKEMVELLEQRKTLKREREEFEEAKKRFEEQERNMNQAEMETNNESNTFAPPIGKIRAGCKELADALQTLEKDLLSIDSSNLQQENAQLLEQVVEERSTAIQESMSNTRKVASSLLEFLQFVPKVREPREEVGKKKMGNESEE